MATTTDEFGRVIPATAPLTSSRGPRGRSQSPPRYGGGGGSSSSRGRGRSRPKHHHSDRDRDHHRSSRHHEDRREWRKRPRSPSTGPSPASQPETTSSSRTATSRSRHPSYRYVEEPMLCEFVWKSQREGGGGGATTAASAAAGSDNENDNNTNSKNGEESPKSNRGEKDPDESGGGEPKETYDEYRKRYCLNYVRSFFNTHMDDSWFRNRYSPLGKKRAVLAERERAKHEARTFQSQMEASLQEVPHGEERCSFVKEARLGGGVKTLAGSEAPIPKTHMLSCAKSENILHITEIPPHVTDEQLTLALMDHCMIPADDQAQGSPVDGGVKLVSGSVTADRPKQPLWREAFLICSAAVKQDIITHLIKAESEAADPTPAPTKETTEVKSEEPAVVVPRKENIKDDKIRSTLPLDVECSDPYGRLDVDADGKGGAPEDGVGVTSRKSTVWVQTQYKTPPVLVLSAAVSSKERLERDKEAAIMMARALDVAKDIPEECRLDEILDKLFGEHRNTEETEDASLIEDILDVSIAYLRRVHLFSFYNGCTFSENVADVLSGRHAAGTIHMRLHNADEILAEDDPKPVSTDDGDSKPAPPKDLLVSRLDASIAKALEECNQWINSGGSTIVSERVDREADDLENAEEEWKDTWLENHAIIDDDGRARCSFHFCHKLFKDKNFLRKHLQKKHKEFLRAEQAQLHDEYMMKAWDEEDQRPVPPVLVDCGANFDLVPSPVLGSEPMAADPEPDLWRKEEERRKREEELQQQRQEQRRLQRENPPERHHHPAGEERRINHANPRPVKNFVDVDDMKEEKVEMAFDTVDVPVQQPKKKKKKKKLL